jgi:hypothetical protein
MPDPTKTDTIDATELEKTSGGTVNTPQFAPGEVLYSPQWWADYNKQFPPIANPPTRLHD